MTTATIDLTIIDELEARDRRLWKPKVYRQDHPRASNVGPCAREIALSVKHWDQKPPPDGHLLQRFDMGIEIERIVIRRLVLAGWDIVEQQQPFEIRESFAWGESHKADDVIICTGHADGRIIRDDGTKPVWEAKSLNPNVWARVNTARDFWNMQGHFWKRYPIQMCLYLYAHSEPLGIFILHDCLGHVKFIPIVLDDWLEETEAALQRCRAATIAKLTGELPDFHDDPSVCQGCWARNVGLCTPPMDFSAGGVNVLEDVELAADLERMEKLREARDEYEGMDKRLKVRMKASGPGQYLAGEFLIDVKEQARAAFKVPDEVKAKYKVEGKATLTKWSRVIGGNENDNGR